MDYKFSNKVGNAEFDGMKMLMKYSGYPGIIPFAGGNPNDAVFPNEKLAKLSYDIFMKNPVTALQYNVASGYLPLRELSAKRAKDKYNIGKDFDECIITTGGMQGMDLTARIFVNEGDTVVAENPSFVGSISSFKSFCANVVGVDLEDDGVNLEQLEHKFKTEKNVKFFYCISTFNNPAGITTSFEKRKKIYELCKKYGVLIVEDNPYGELRYAGEPVMPIKSLDEDGIVIYVSSYSKVVAPGLRVGYVIAPKEITAEIIRAKQWNDMHTNIFTQILVTEFINSVNFDDHIDGIKKLYGHKCSLMMSEFDKKFDKSVKRTTPEGGMFMWCTLPGEQYDTLKLVQIAGDRGVITLPGISFATDGRKTSNSIRLNFTAPSDEQIVEGMDILAKCVSDFIK